MENLVCTQESTALFRLLQNSHLFDFVAIAMIGVFDCFCMFLRHGFLSMALQGRDSKRCRWKPKSDAPCGTAACASCFAMTVIVDPQIVWM